MPRSKQHGYLRNLASQDRWLKDDKKLMDAGAPMSARNARKRVYAGDEALSKNFARAATDHYHKTDRPLYADGGKVIKCKPNGKAR